MKYIAYICLLLGFSFNAFAQEKIGLTTDNYLPVYHVSNNPASILDQKPWLSVNVMGFHASIRNNFMHIANSRLGPKSTDFPIAYDSPNKDSKGFMSLEVLGPSFSIASGKNGFGFHTALRSYANLNNLPGAMGQIIANQGVDSAADGTYQINNGRIKSMTWAEIGVSYGRIVYSKGTRMMSTALSLNRLVGIHQTNMIIDNAEIEVRRGSGTLKNLQGEYSYSDVAMNAGSGWSLNSGFVYKKMLIKNNVDNYYAHSRKVGCKAPEYHYKIGVSLLDVGYIRFKENSQNANLSDSLEVGDIEKGIAKANEINESNFTAILPTALSLQADYRLRDYVYLNAIIVQKISLATSLGVERSNVFAISPRFESRWFTASIPLSLSNYTAPQMGLYFRLGYLAIGTDHLSPFIRTKDINAVDLYFSLNIPIQNSADCRKRPSASKAKWSSSPW